MIYAEPDLSASGIVGEAWALYRSHWQHFIAIALAVFLILALITLALGIALGIAGGLIGLLISVVGLFWVQGALVLAVEDVRDGRADLGARETLSRVSPRISVLIGAGILAWLGITVGLVLLIVPGLILLTWWILIVPVIMLEDSAVIEAFGRSRELVRGYGWSVLGVILLTLLLYVAAWFVVGIALFWLPNGLEQFLVDIIASSLTAPLVATAWTLLYYRLRELQGPAV